MLDELTLCFWCSETNDQNTYDHYNTCEGKHCKTNGDWSWYRSKNTFAKINNKVTSKTKRKRYVQNPWRCRCCSASDSAIIIGAYILLINRRWLLNNWNFVVFDVLIDSTHFNLDETRVRKIVAFIRTYTNGCHKMNEPLSILVIIFFLFDSRSWLFLEKMRRQILYKTVVNYISVKR